MRDKNRAEPERNMLTMVKGKHRYVIRYKPGSEELVRQELESMAENPDITFDRFDANVLSYLLGKNNTV